MKSIPADDPANFPYPNAIHPALTSFADEVCATVARMFAYVGVLALFGIMGIHAWDKLQADMAESPAPEAGWSVADRSYPAFALSPPDSSDKTDKSDTYVVFRHPLGGRKDVLRWSGPTDKPLAELEIYRPGSEYPTAAEARAHLAARMVRADAELEAAGVIESKFGPLALLRQTGVRDGPSSCLGFFTRIDAPQLQISGWSCQGDNLSTRRTTIACMLNRLTPLNSGNEPRLAELFAHAELKRGNCAAGSEDWMTARENPSLRGIF